MTSVARPPSIAAAIPSAALSPPQKHVQIVGRAASEQLLFKFPDLRDDDDDDNDEEADGSYGYGGRKVKQRRLSVDLSLIIPCFHSVSSSYSWKQSDMGSATMLQSHHHHYSSSAFFDPSYTSPLLSRSSRPLKRHGCSKAMQRFVKGASNCIISNKYKMRIVMASKRYKLRASLGPHRELL